MHDPTTRELKILLDKLEQRMDERFEAAADALRLAHSDARSNFAIWASLIAVVASVVIPLLLHK